MGQRGPGGAIAALHAGDRFLHRRAGGDALRGRAGDLQRTDAAIARPALRLLVPVLRGEGGDACQCPVHVKTVASQKHRALLRSRKLLQEKALAIESDIRGLLRNFGLKVGIVGAGGFELRVRDLIEALPDLGEMFGVLRAARQKLREAFSQLHRKVLGIVRDMSARWPLPRWRNVIIGRNDERTRCRLPRRSCRSASAGSRSCSGSKAARQTGSRYR
ncbi:hypothetical protein SAMN04244567_03549 [Paracoccus pantotrophus]|nr:hypothetical protein SAMN04244567_03549 [Paracoccus pantotrophus]